MSRLKYLHDTFSPCQELWALVGECSSMQNILDEISEIDHGVKHKREYHSIFVKLDDIKRDLSVLRSCASRCTCISLLNNPDDLSFSDVIREVE